MLGPAIAILYCYLLSAFLFCIVMLIAMTQHVTVAKSTAMTYIGWGAVFICAGAIFAAAI